MKSSKLKTCLHCRNIYIVDSITRRIRLVIEISVKELSKTIFISAVIDKPNFKRKAAWVIKDKRMTEEENEF